MSVPRYVRRGLVIYAALILAVPVLEDAVMWVASRVGEYVEGREA